MISRPLTRVVNSTEMSVAPGATITAEGAALTRLNGQTSNGVVQSTGSGEVFQGFSFAGTSAYPFNEVTASKAETFTVSNVGTLTLAETPVGTQWLAYDVTAKAAITANIALTGNVVSGTGLVVGHVVTVVYQYNQTMVQFVAQKGNVQPGGYAGALVQQIGVITKGLVFTDQFDASKDWSTAGSSATTAIITGPNGVITIGASSTGVVVPATVVRLPDDEYPFLGLQLL